MHPLTRQEVRIYIKNFLRICEKHKVLFIITSIHVYGICTNFISLLLLYEKQQQKKLWKKKFSHLFVQFVKSSLHCWCTFILLLTLYLSFLVSFHYLFWTESLPAKWKEVEKKLLKVISFEYRLNGLIILLKGGELCCAFYCGSLWWSFN